MNAVEIFNTLHALEQAAPKAKIDILKKALQDKAFENFVQKALDPSIRYGAVYKEDWNHMVAGNGNISFDPTANNPYYAELMGLADKSSGAVIENIVGRVCPVSRQLIKRVLNKDLRCGVGVETVNKAVPGTIPVFKCMLAHPFEESRIKKWPVAVQEKLDGIRVLAIGGKNDNFVFYTRTGKEITSLDHISEELKKVLSDMETNEDQIVFDGEVVTSSFNDTVSKVRKKSEQAETAVFHVFDAIPLPDFGLPQYRVPLTGRTAWLKHALGERLERLNVHSVKMLETKFAVNTEDIMLMYAAIRDKGGEGVIVKPLDGIYEKRRSHNWLKIKDCNTADVKIIGFEEGTGKYVGKLGALIVDFNGVEVKVGSGLTDLLRTLIWRDKDEWLGRLIEVEYHEVTPDGSLRHPRFIRDRTGDKPHEDGHGAF